MKKEIITMNNIKENNIKELKELLEKELIIPEIQRDYVWGNNEIVIKRFINNIKNSNGELDIGFFYSYKIYEDSNALIDGQQRITTLILLNWYAGINDLCNFKFKVRENSNKFLEELLKNKIENINNVEGEKFSDKIKNSIWYKNMWNNDPTVKSILNALDIIDNELKSKKEEIKNKITNIKFLCIEAGDRSLEIDYILLNSRGVKLTNSEQLKAILTEDIEKKDEWLKKWEKDWQDILWECKEDNIYNTDKIWNAVLLWVRDIYVIENSICEDNNKDNKKINYNYDLIGIEKVDDKEKVLKILDWVISVLKIINYNNNLDMIQEKCQFENKEKNIKNKIQGKDEKYSINDKVLLYGILYLIKNEYNIENLESLNNIENRNKQLNNDILDKIRILRNLIQHSNIDKSNLDKAIVSLKENINKLSYVELYNKRLEVLNGEQQEEEALKLEIFEKYSEYKDIIIKIENDKLFEGKIKNIFLLFLSVVDENNNELKDNYKLKDFYKNKKDILLKIFENNINKLKNLFNIYKELKKEENKIWGELLLEEDVYESNKNDIWLRNEFPPFLKLLYLYIIKVDKNIKYDTVKLLDEFLIKIRKENIKRLLDKYDDISKIKDPKEQLYILYIIGYDNKYFVFKEVNNNKNFGVYGNKYKYENEKEKERLEKSPFNHKLVFQSYRERWVGGQPFVETEEILKEYDIQKLLEKYTK